MSSEKAHSLMTCESRPGWWQVLSPAIYLISLLPAATVSFLNPGAPLGILWLAAIGVLLIQHAVNVANDYMDWIRGADSEKSNTWVLWHHEDLSSVKRHSTISLIGGLVLGIVSVFLLKRGIILVFALPLVALGLLYNRVKAPLSYSALGDWTTFLCYGGVFGCLYFLGNGSSPWILAGGSVAYGLLAFSILLAHQPEQVFTDGIAGKRCFAVRNGVPMTHFTSVVSFEAFLGLIVAIVAASGKISFQTGTFLFIGFSLWSISQSVPTPKKWLLAAVLFHTCLVLASFRGGI